MSNVQYLTDYTSTPVWADDIMAGMVTGCDDRDVLTEMSRSRLAFLLNDTSLPCYSSGDRFAKREISRDNMPGML